jgi:hypothetical protein
MIFSTIQIFFLLLAVTKSQSKLRKNFDARGQKEAIEGIFREFSKPEGKPVDVIILGSSPKGDKFLSYIQTYSSLFIKKNSTGKIVVSRPSMIISNDTKSVVKFLNEEVELSLEYRFECKFLVYVDNLDMNQIVPSVPTYRMGHAI